MKKGKILSTKLTKAKKAEIYQTALQHFKKSGLNKTCHFFQVMTEIDERIDWLLRLKNFFSRYKNASFEELKLIQENFKIDYTLEETIQMWHEEKFFSMATNFQKAMKKYSPLIGGLEYHLTILEEISEVTDAEWDESKKEMIIQHPIEREIARRFLNNYIKEKKELIEMLVEFFPERDCLPNLIPANIKRANSAGRLPEYPIRMQITKDFWEKNRETILKRVKNSKGDYTLIDVVRELKEQVKVINAVDEDTIKSWVGLK